MRIAQNIALWLSYSEGSTADGKPICVLSNIPSLSNHLMANKNGIVTDECLYSIVTKCSWVYLTRTTTVKTISKFRIRQKLHVVTKLGDKHVVLGQKHKGIAERFFVVRSNFERVLQNSQFISVDAELQRDTKTGQVSLVNHTDIDVPIVQLVTW